MKRVLSTAFLLALFVSNAQETISENVAIVDVVAVDTTSQASNGQWYGLQDNYVKFTNAQKKFRSWSVGVYGGTSLIQSGDLNSFDNDEFNLGYDVHATVTKHINHVVGLGVQFNLGETRQSYGEIKGKTEYMGASFLGDINLTSLFRRVDNKSRYAWAMHVYGTVGFLGYKAKRNEGGGYMTITDQDLDYTSFFSSVGTGLRYKISNALDVEAKAMFVMTGDETFDASGNYQDKYSNLEEGRDDTFITANLGLIYKISSNKNHEHLMWFDPLAELYPPSGGNGVFCETDNDEDGVCDEIDKQLDTPLGARVDGGGVALDVDNDTVIDLYDRCVTVPGLARSQDDPQNGCPDAIVIESISEIADLLSQQLKGIEFELNSYKIRPQSHAKLDNAVSIIKKYPDYTYIVEGHTDAYGSYDYNLKLSQERADEVVKYLTDKGVEKYKLRAVGKGEAELLLPQCNPADLCTNEQNEQNRRVIFIPGDIKSGSAKQVIKKVEKVEASNNPIEQYQNQKLYQQVEIEEELNN